MRVVSSPIFFLRSVRPLAGLACLFVALPMLAAPVADKTADDSGAKTISASDSSTKNKSRNKSGKDQKSSKAKAKGKSAANKAAQRARTARIKKAFVASEELRAMAQQLATQRTPSAYAGVLSYARKHSGDAAAAAYMALGHAYLLDKRYDNAIENFRAARQNGDVMADYADFLMAKASYEARNYSAAEEVLHGFTASYPDSVFASQVPELEANTLLALGEVAAAQKVLDAAANTDAASRPGFQLAQGLTVLASGDTKQAVSIFKRLLLGHPLSAEAAAARAKMTVMGVESSLTVAELSSLGDAYYNGGHYGEAGEQYRILARHASLDETAHNSFAVAAAACDLKLKRLTVAQAQALADTNDESGARRLYLLMELARNRDDLSEQQRIVTEMETRFPQSNWLAEALFSSGNMYLLRREYPRAVEYYSYLATHFPDSKTASAAHWRAGWLSYRQALYADAARLFDEQIRLYPASKETASAIYWRGRLYETVEHKPDLAAANYRTLVRVYPRYFYAQMARRRLAALGDVSTGAAAVTDAQLSRVQAPPVPELTDDFPEDSPHLAKARLLANAGMNDYISQEIKADPDSDSWSGLAEAQIYASSGETFRALRILKRALPMAATAPVASVPLAYWRILYPEPYWETIKAEAAKNNLDPYLVASLIRQESEFNPSAISGANAYGLMQLLPAVGKTMARQGGLGQYQDFHLLDPATNIRLGTRYLRQTLDKFGGVPEYALAAYNAGATRVEEWKAAAPNQEIDEFVESIPFTETREYVQAILRNQETYRAIDEYVSARSQGDAKPSQRGAKQE
jgi:soluble lytic murein transglycosylase